jgi:hypothetical protein
MASGKVSKDWAKWRMPSTSLPWGGSGVMAGQVRVGRGFT